MAPRIHVPRPEATARWQAGQLLELPEGAARHVQVLRAQPGTALRLFDGQGGEWTAEIAAMARRDVQVRLLEHQPVERELPMAVTLAVCMPTNDRMDDLVEKATELGVHTIAPLMSERSVLRLSGERAQRKQAHWQAVAIAACEQCGRNRVPQVLEPLTLQAFLSGSAASDGGRAAARWQLSLAENSRALHEAAAVLTLGAPGRIEILSGPEGGLSASEQALAAAAGFEPVSLGPRVLRADTAPLAALAVCSTLWMPTVSATAQASQTG